MNFKLPRPAVVGIALLTGGLALAGCDNLQDLTNGSASQAGAMSWSEVYPVFARSCMPCHNSGNKPDFSDSAAVKATAAKIASAVREGWMPTAGTVPFSPAQKALLLKWADTTAKTVPQKGGD